MLCIGPRHSPHFPFNSSFVVYCLHRFHRPDVGRIHLAEVHLLVPPCYASSQWTDEVEIEWRGGRMWWQLVSSGGEHDQRRAVVKRSCTHRWPLCCPEFVKVAPHPEVALVAVSSHQLSKPKRNVDPLILYHEYCGVRYNNQKEFGIAKLQQVQ